MRNGPCWREEQALDRVLRLLQQVQGEWLKTIRERDELLEKLQLEKVE